VERALAGRDVAIDVGDDATATVDPRLTATCLAHLLENAAHYTPAGTAIEVTARREDSRLVLTVRDHGPGVAAADLPHLFDRFYRGQAAQGHVAGTGMGLAIVRGLLAVQGGRVWEENHPAGGAEFTISLPVRAAASQDPTR
jgi:signal transduction histidine kinase